MCSTVSTIGAMSVARSAVHGGAALAVNSNEPALEAHEVEADVDEADVERVAVVDRAGVVRGLAGAEPPGGRRRACRARPGSAPRARRCGGRLRSDRGSRPARTCRAFLGDPRLPWSVACRRAYLHVVGSLAPIIEPSERHIRGGFVHRVERAPGGRSWPRIRGAAWWTSIPSPPTACGPRSPRRRPGTASPPGGRSRSTAHWPVAGRVDREGLAGHAERGGVDDDVEVRGRAPGSSVDGRGAGRELGRGAAPPRRAGPRPSPARRPDRARAPRPGRRHRRRARARVRPPTSSPASARLRTSPSPSVESPSRVPSSRQHDGVHDLERGRVRAELVAGACRVGLVRHRDAEARRCRAPASPRTAS